MKPLFAATLGSLMLLNSCVFDSPFEAVAMNPVNPALVGRWETVPASNEATERLLVMEYSPNEYAVEYPVGDDAMFFRAFEVELSGAKYIQLQLIGKVDKTVDASDRKYHLVKVSVNGDAMEMRTIVPEVLGKDLAGSVRMKAAFEEHKDDPKLFGDPQKFRRIE